MARKNLAELREEMRAVARGDRGAAPIPAAPLLAALSREALDLLGVILRHRPETIADLVATTGRAQPNVSRSLQQLAGHGLIRLQREGREVRPVPVAREVRVDLTTGTCAAVPLQEADTAT